MDERLAGLMAHPTDARDMAIYFLPISPGSGEQGSYNRRDVDFLFLANAFAWKWRVSQGWGGPWPTVRMRIARETMDPWYYVSDWITPATNDYDFVVDLPDGQYLAWPEVQDGSVVPGMVVLPKEFAVNASGSPLPDDYVWTATRRFEHTYGQTMVGAVKVQYPGLGAVPKSFPLKAREVQYFSDVPPMNQLWVRRFGWHQHAVMTRRWVRKKDGSLGIEADQKYFYSDVKGDPQYRGWMPAMTLQDGPKYVGALGFVYKGIVSPSDRGFYFCDTNGRMGFQFIDGRVLTLAGVRVKPGEEKAHSHILRENPVSARAFYDAKWEIVGDWSQVPDPKWFEEPWGFEAHGGHHEFWVCDTLNHRILYLNHYTAHGEANYRQPEFPPPGYAAPAAPTGTTQLYPFETGLSEPWDCTKAELDGVQWLYWTEYLGNAIWRRRLDGSQPKELVLQCSRNPTNAELGINDPPYRLVQSVYTAQQLRDTMGYWVDGPLGTATCVRPQGIVYDPVRRRIIWAERYTYLVRYLEMDTGEVKTLWGIGKFTPERDGITGKGFGQQDISLAISDGTYYPQGHLFINCWHDTDYVIAPDGAYVGRIMGGQQQLLSGPVSACRTPNYGWTPAVGRGRLYLIGSAGGQQSVEITRRLTTDLVFDSTRAKRGLDNWKASLATLTNGPYGQGALGFPTIDEIGSWDDQTIREYLAQIGVPNTSDDTLYWIRSDTSDLDYSTEPPPPPPQDCVLGEWSEWSEWEVDPGDPGREVRSRTREILIPPSGGGAECGPTDEYEYRPVVMPAPTKDEALAALEVVRSYVGST